MRSAFEPEGLFKNRFDEECVFALVVQWIAKYGEKEYKDIFSIIKNLKNLMLILPRLWK